MKTFNEISLCSFEFWSGAKSHANLLTLSELDNLEFILEDLYPEGISETTLNDIMWFDFDWVCECLGLVYENGEIIR